MDASKSRLLKSALIKAELTSFENWEILMDFKLRSLTAIVGRGGFCRLILQTTAQWSERPGSISMFESNDVVSRVISRSRQ